MHLSDSSLSVLQYLAEGWVLVQGKVIPGAVTTTLLRKMKDGKIVEVKKVSNATLRFLVKKDLVRQAKEDLTVYYFSITEKGKKEVTAPR